jgi:HEAT repeat protein
MGLRKAAEAAPLRRVEAREYARDLPGLLEQLQDSSASVRRWAARDLADEPLSGSAICARLAIEPDATVRSVLFTTATRLGGRVVAKAMMDLLRSEDPGLRNGAIEVLSSMPDTVSPHIDALLEDPDGDVRIFTVNLLGDLRHPHVTRWLEQVLATDKAINVVGAALELLVEVGGPQTLPALKATRARFPDDDYIAFAVQLAIDRIESA